MAESLPSLAALRESEKNPGGLKVEEETGVYSDETIATLLEDFRRLTPKQKIMVCEIVRALALLRTFDQ